MSDIRAYPERPYLAVSAAIFRDGKLLIVRRAMPPVQNVFTLPGGAVETGETLTQAVVREIKEETALDIEPVELAGFREVILRDKDGRIERHFVVLCFAARYRAGSATPNEELAELRWIDPAEVSRLRTTPGLAEIIAEAVEKLGKP